MAKTKAACSAPAPDRKWEVEDAVRTLTRAEEIKADPKMMEAVATMAKEKVDDMKAVERLAKRGLVSDKQMAKAKAKAGKR